MKFCATASIIAVLAGSASAFVMPTLSTSVANTASTSKASETTTEEKDTTPVISVAPVTAESAETAETAESSEAVETEEADTYNPLGLEPGRYANIDYSVSFRSLQRPPKLDGSHAGDFGFDPLGFTESNDLYYLQECELRHARLAMLAVVGWPLSELVAPSWMLQDGRAPSVLNGVNPVSALAILTAFSAFGYFEYQTSIRRTTGTTLGDKHLSDMSNIWKYGVAGDYDFDPLNFYSLLGNDAKGRKGLRELEITQGRYAMLGITSFAAWEKLTGHPIVENSMFFHPNALLPFLCAAYFGWSQIYEVSDLSEYPIKIQYTKDGEEILNGLKRNRDSAQQSLEDVKETVDGIMEKVDQLGLKEKADQLGITEKIEELKIQDKIDDLKTKITKSIEMEA